MSCVVCRVFNQFIHIYFLNALIVFKRASPRVTGDLATKDVRQWSLDDVCAWVNQQGEVYARGLSSRFRSYGLRVEDLIELKDEDLHRTFELKDPFMRSTFLKRVASLSKVRRSKE